jgi:hypothetical protein
MRRNSLLAIAMSCLACSITAAGSGELAASSTQASLTIYNQMFAVVRQIIPLDLNAGVNQIRYNDITTHLEPDSVIMRDPGGARRLQILEQNYRNDPVSQELLLSLNEGKTIEFATKDKEGNDVIVPGKIIRSGYVPHYTAMSQYGPNYAMQQYSYAQGGSGQPIIEVHGKLQFSLPGMPIFPALADDTILKPTLDWQIETDKPGVGVVELSYVTGGMRWQADYNVVAPEQGDVLDVVGWVTFDNQSGKTFPNARIKLMAGDVSKIQQGGIGYGVGAATAMRSEAVAPAVTERKFDEYHLYTLERPTTLRDREMKQVEFIRASGVQAQRVYVYDGIKLDPNFANWPMENIRQNPTYGTQSNPKVWVMQEFKNSEANHLGMPLPKGRVRFYRRDKDGQVEFTGENVIDHTPKDEMLRFYTGNAFDLVGERRRTYYKLNSSENWIDEGFEIKLRNHTKAATEIRVVEHLYRWSSWEISQKSAPFKKLDSQTIEFRITVPADGESTLTYMVHYSW